MPRVILTRDDFLQDRQGKTFADVVNDPEQPFDAVLDFFNDEDRQRRMGGSEIHHERRSACGSARKRKRNTSRTSATNRKTGKSA